MCRQPAEVFIGPCASLGRNVLAVEAAAALCASWRSLLRASVRTASWILRSSGRERGRGLWEETVRVRTRAQRVKFLQK